MKTIKTLKQLFQNGSYETASNYACVACYYIMLSAAPAFTFLLATMHSHPLLHDLLKKVGNHSLFTITEASDLMFVSVVRFESILIWLWSASKGIWSVNKGMEAILDHKINHNYIMKRLSAITQFIILNTSFIIVLLTSIWGRHLILFVENTVFPIPIKYDLIFSVILLIVLFSLYYYMHSHTRIQFRFCVVGAVLASVGWVIISNICSFFANILFEQNDHDNFISLLTLSVVWLRICIIILLYGIKYADFRQRGNSSFIVYLTQQFRSTNE